MIGKQTRTVFSAYLPSSLQFFAFIQISTCHFEHGLNNRNSRSPYDHVDVEKTARYVTHMRNKGVAAPRHYSSNK